MTRLDPARLSRSLLSLSLWLGVALTVTAGGCKLTTSGLPKSPFGGGGSSPTTGANRPVASAPTSTAEVVPVASQCEKDSRTDEEKADGVPAAPCGDPKYNTPEYVAFDSWRSRKRFIRPQVVAAPGRETVGRFRAPWCKESPDDSAGRLEGEVRDAIAGEDRLLGSEPQLAMLLCIDPEDPRFQDLSGAYVQQLVNESGGTVAEVTAYLALWGTQTYQALNVETCSKHKLEDGASERASAIASLENPALGCDRYSHDGGPPLFLGGSDTESKHGLWHLDRYAAPPSQLSQLALLSNCLNSGEDFDMWALVNYGLCRPMIATMDDQALAAELTAAGYNAQARATAALSMSNLRMRLALTETKLQQRIGKDADLREILLDAPQRGWNQWVEAYQRERAAVDAAYAYEDVLDGTSISATKGCLPAAAAAFYGYLGKRAPSTRAAVLAAATDPVGGILATRLRACLTIEGVSPAAALFESIITNGSPRRGPRFAAVVEMRSALAKVLTDRTRFAIEPSMPLLQLDGPVPVGFNRGESFDTQEGGVVAKVETRGDETFVTFKVEKWLEDEYLCKETNKIISISNNGDVIYERNCHATGNKRPMTSQAYSIRIPSVMSANVTPGNFVRFWIAPARDDGFFSAAPLDVWTDKKATKLLAFAGVATK